MRFRCLCFLGLSLSHLLWADESTNVSALSNSGSTDAVVATSSVIDNSTQNIVEARAQKENKVLNNPFAISFYQPTYIMPFYYTGSPDNAVYQGNTPNNEPLMHEEIKFQFSLKYPLWQFSPENTLYIAYTQLSYWQAYQSSSFFRETDYQPEIFLANEINLPLVDGWKSNFFNIGAMHQSNGDGDSLERSWNRIYVNAIEGKGNWMVQVQPWYIVQDSSMENYNPDIGRYLGYGQVIFSYKFSHQVFALQVRNELESAFSRGALQFTWSFPVGIRHLKGYVQVFSGYGQSLVEYNHYTNSAGVGISLSDWL